MNKSKASWIALGLLVVLCFIIFKDYLSLNKAYYFYDICGDGFYCSYPTFCALADYIGKHGVASWSFQVGMGQNMFPFMLRDPFDIILYLGGKNNVLALTIYVEVAKIIFTGYVFYKYLKLLALSDYIAITGCLLFAFCGFITEASAWFAFTFEAFNFALFLLGFELFFLRKNWFLLSFAVFLICISMPFNIYIYGIFMILYTIFRHLQTGTLDLIKLRNLFIQLLGIAIVGLLLSGPFLLQNISLLLHSPRGADPDFIKHQIATSRILSFSSGNELGTSIMRFFSNDILGSGSNFKGWDTILGAALFYCGLPCLLLVPQVFQFLDKRIRKVFVVFISLWLVPVLLPFFRRALWMFTGDYYRGYSLLVAFVFIYFSLLALEQIFKQRKVNLIVLIITLATLLIFLYHPFLIDKNIIDIPIQRFVTIMLVTYSIILIFVNRFKNISYFKYIFFIAVLVELAYSGWITANRRDALGYDWLGGEIYNNSTNDAVKYIKQTDATFYRIDKNFDPPTQRYTNLNFSQAQGYNGTSSYNPFNEQYYVQYLQTVGIADKSKEEDSRWAIGLLDNPILQSENNVKYFLGLSGFHPAWPEMWDSVVSVGIGTGKVTVFKNKFVLPFGFGYNHYIKESNFNLAPPLQKKFITLQAVIVSDKETDKVKKLKEFQLSDTLTGPLDFNAFAKQLDELKKDTLAISNFDDTRLSASVNLSEDKLIYLSIPYDDGWQLIEDVTEIKPIIVNGGMMGIFMEKGKHHLELFYKLRYMKKGGLMTLIGLIIVLIGYWSYFRQKIKTMILEVKLKIKDIQTRDNLFKTNSSSTKVALIKTNIKNGKSQINLTGYTFTDKEIAEIKNYLIKVKSDIDFSELIAEIEMRNKKGYDA